jgi:hypothetical protein
VTSQYRNLLSLRTDVNVPTSVTSLDKALKKGFGLCFFVKKLHFTGSIKEVQAKIEAFSSQKRTSSTSKNFNLLTFFYCWSFLPATMEKP